MMKWATKAVSSLVKVELPVAESLDPAKESRGAAWCQGDNIHTSGYVNTCGEGKLRSLLVAPCHFS